MERITDILKQVKPDADFSISKCFVDDGILDSIDIVSLILKFEEEFGIEINPEEIDPDNFQSVEAMFSMIERAKGI